MSEVVTLLVPPELHGGRADKVVTELCAKSGVQATRAEVQRWIAAGRVTLQGRTIDNRTPLATGSEVRVEPSAGQTTTAKPDASIALDVVFEDEHLLVIDKPAGLVVHPARGHYTGTLVHGLLAREGFEASDADVRDPEGHLRPGIVHRLDKDTSGLLVVAKRPEAREALKELFSRHDIERSYLAIVHGQARAAVIDTPHGRHPKSRLRFTSLLEPGPSVRRAVTRVEPLELLGTRASLVCCTLETGRTHQIRVHLAERSQTPIFADPLYGRAPADPDLRAIAEALGRQALHAAVLGFVHPVTRAAMRWESALPADMSRALDALRACGESQLRRPK